MKDKNKAMLFVNSVSVYRAPDKSIQNHKLHRLDDIKALLSFKKIINVEIMSFQSKYIGEIKEISEDEIILVINNEFKIVKLDSISSLRIISTK